MLRNKLVRSDGSIIDSSVIISCEFTEEVNSHTNLSVGDVTASELTVEILSIDPPIKQGEVLTYSIIEDGVETKIGEFIAEKPTVATRTSMKFSAYDNVVKTEKNFSDWLRDNQDRFPMSLYNLTQYASGYCGVILDTEDFPHADLQVNAFYADNLTCRQVLAWASAIAGRFVLANANGHLEFSWYKEAADITIEPSKLASQGSVYLSDDGEGNVSVASESIELVDDGDGNVTINTNGLSVVTTGSGVALAAASSIPYLRDTLSYESYTTDTIKRVQINHSEDDVGTIYPDDNDGNCFTISENMILGGLDSTEVMRVATSLYTQLKDISYVPFSVTVPRTIGIRAGDIINVTTSSGKSFTTYVMKVVVAASGTTLTTTGDKSYGSSAAVSSEKYSNLTGKILSIKKSVDGLAIKNANLEGQVASLILTTDGLDTFVGSEIEGALAEYDVKVGTKLSQTEGKWDFKFGEVSGDISGLDEEVKRQLEERKANIRFEDGNIILGRATSDIQLILKNNRVSFVKNVTGYPELAYISDDILYITNGEFLEQLRIGKFGFKPGENGNLSFKKVVT